ncbi:transcription factor TGAL5 [Dendrobium catenatum]|uniref:TGACG-sequence-specific DNA-binding protein TGA-2.1 n=1 Tax=Dendrobium catenatum TaxID=906689 RepID=A0A2I0VPR8_9ASPA|nr:transcription factor TGAL5 [Dendrobium catenatum]XP_020678381.1 transcription factor TGAL5 [Dendrobium catenatum]PKU65402.1 TGACG-sequence-specific DNA-binding protein TGA-2.1 [Dendrobium catenatum]
MDRMSDHRVGETGLSDSGPSNQPLTYGLHGFSPAGTNFFDQEGAAYFEELEEALMQGVVGIRSDGDTKTYLTTRPPTLEIFPSWPMRFHHNTVGNSQSAESSDSGSAQNTISQLESESPVSRKDDYSELFTEQQQQQQQQQMIPSDGSKTEIGTAGNHQSRDQDKRRLTTEKDGRNLDAKTLRRLAQNREAARKSRLRKKAYVQQLESSRMKLAQLEQDLQRARSQGLLIPGASTNGGISSGAEIFDMEYAQWLDENYKHMAELQGGLQAHLPDGNLRVIVDDCLKHYDEIFRLKTIAAKSDVFHLITGMWTTPAERCFLWMGGFRPSDLLKILMPHLDPLTEQQLVGLCNLQQSSQQAEEALSQGLEQLQQSLADTVASGSLSEDPKVGNYMGQMAMALGKIGNLEGFVRQADNLRQQTLHQLRRILTIRQAARCFLAIGEYNSRLRALSSLWSSRPRENSIATENSFAPATSLQILQQPVDAHFSVF